MKRALFFGTPFFNYYLNITSELEAQGYSVDHFNDRPSENPITKGLLKIRPSLIAEQTERHFEQIIDRVADKDYDLVLIVNGKALSAAHMTRLRTTQPNAEFVLYLWDAVRLYPRSLDLAAHADRAYTFDSEDAERYSARLTLLPLFFNRHYEAVGNTKSSEQTYDIASVCTVHPNRQALLGDVFDRLRAEGVSIFDYRYIHPLQYVQYRATRPEFKKAPPNDFRFRPLAPTDYIQVLTQSSAVFDINHSAQSGLTMRTIETVGARRKLITTNQAVRDYRFYDPTRIHIFSPKSPDLAAIQKFLKRSQVPLPEAEYQKYSIHSWTNEIVHGGNYGNSSLFIR